MRSGSAVADAVFALAGVGGVTLAAVSSAATGTPAEPILMNATMALAAAALWWLGRQIIDTRDAVRTLTDPKTGVVVRLETLEHDVRRLAHHVGLEPEE